MSSAGVDMYASGAAAGGVDRDFVLAAILEHLEAEGLHLARTVVEEDIAATFGARVDASPAALARGLEGSSSVRRGLRPGESHLLCLLRTHQALAPAPSRAARPGATDTIDQKITQPSARPPALAAESKGNTLQIPAPLAIKTKVNSMQAPSPAQSPLYKFEPRTPLTVLPSATGGGAGAEALVFSAKKPGVVAGGTAAGLVQWVVDCAHRIFLVHHYGAVRDGDAEDLELSRARSDVVDFLATFTEIMTPESLVTHMEQLARSDSSRGWGVQRLLLDWLDLFLHQLPLRTRRSLMKRLINIAIVTLRSTHHDHGKTIDVESATPATLISSLPQNLAGALRSAEASLLVDERATEFVDHVRPTHSHAGSHGLVRSPRIRPKSRGGSAASVGSSGGRISPYSPAASPSGGASFRKTPTRHPGGEFFDYPLELIAEQLTLMDSLMFRAIPSLEFLDKAWERDRYEHVAEHTRRLLDRFNAFPEYLCTLILHTKSVEERRDHIVYLINLGRHLVKHLHNYFSGSMVYFTLVHDSMTPLTQSWALVPPESKKVMDVLRRIFSHERNYAGYRGSIAQVDPAEPALPALHVHHSDLFGVTENVPRLLCRSCGTACTRDDKKCRRCGEPVDRDVFNFDRMRALSVAMEQVRCHQAKRYQLQPDKQICNMIDKGLDSHILFFKQARDRREKTMYMAAQSLER